MSPARRRPVTLEEAATAADLSTDDLLQLHAEIRAAAAAGSKLLRGGPRALEPPSPTNEDGGPVWDRDDYQPWAMRMGLWSPYRGRRLIGYAGIAWLTGLTEQWLQKLRVKQAERGEQPEDMPDPIKGPKGEVVYFDAAAILRWARQTGKLQGTDRRITS